MTVCLSDWALHAAAILFLTAAILFLNVLALDYNLSTTALTHIFCSELRRIRTASERRDDRKLLCCPTFGRIMHKLGYAWLYLFSNIVF